MYEKMARGEVSSERLISRSARTSSSASALTQLLFVSPAVLPPAVKAFARRSGYGATMEDPVFTFRAGLIGSIFALLNAVVNMLFAFRYAGGLAQYYVILLAYVARGGSTRRK